MKLLFANHILFYIASTYADFFLNWKLVMVTKRKLIFYFDVHPEPWKFKTTTFTL